MPIILEQSTIGWGQSVTEKNKNYLERTQKLFLKLIIKEKYTHYEESLLKVKLETLEVRRLGLSLKFAKDCIRNEEFKILFPENSKPETITKHHEKYKVPHRNTERMKHSSIIHMIHQLNQDERKN